MPFGGRDHPTVLHAVRKMEHLKDTDPSIAAEIESLVKVIQQAA